jgi:hypothetical protein
VVHLSFSKESISRTLSLTFPYSPEMLTSAKTTDAIKHIIIAVVAVFTALEKSRINYT